MKSPEAELERRRPVWEALSNLFLDTELQAADHERIAEVVAASGYTDGEIEWILRRELGPILGVNLLTTAGEWACFDMDGVERAILGRRTSWRRFLPCFKAYSMIREDWEAVRRRVHERRATQASPATHDAD